MITERDKTSGKIKSVDTASFLARLGSSKPHLKLDEGTFTGMAKKAHPDLSYKPDFKVSDTLFVNVDGLYWHSADVLADRVDSPVRYHLRYRQSFESKGLRLLQFTEDEVRDKTDIVVSIINNAAGKIEDKVYARETVPSKTPAEEAKVFFSDNHLMGYSRCKYVGLYFNGKLVSSLGYVIKSRELRVERFCSLLATVVVGGFEKLLKFVSDSEAGKFDKVVNWVDLRYGTGTHLLNKGFVVDKETLGWRWTDLKLTYNRLRCRANMDDRKLSEREHAAELKLKKIYDAGQRKYVKKV